MTLKFYVASSFQNKEVVRVVSSKLKELGWQHTYDWTRNERADSIEALKRIGELEVKAVADSDVVIVILPGGKGSHIELGMAIAWQKKIFLYSPNLEAMNMTTTSTFYHVQGVRICEGSIENLIADVFNASTSA